MLSFWYVSFYSITFFFFFLRISTIQLRSLRSVVLPDPSSVPPAQATATVNSAQRRRRIIFLFLEAVTQILYMGWLVKI
jgi:protein transport protein YIF1